MTFWSHSPVLLALGVTWRLWLPVAAVPVTVIGYVPAATEDPTVAVSVELPPDVTELGLKETLTPDGAPEAARLTDSALPEVTAVDTAAVAEPPWVTEAEPGDRDTEKSLVVPPPPPPELPS